MTTRTINHNHRLVLPHWRKYINPWRWVPLAIIFIPTVNSRADRLTAWLIPDPKPSELSEPDMHTVVPIAIGTTISGYEVSSDFGPRPQPCPGCSTDHRGIDLRTPIGTPIYAPRDTEVTCKAEAAAGNYAQFPVDGEVYLALHLSQCKSGPAKAGEQIGLTGNTGNGSGPHLDVRKQDKTMPAKGVIARVLAPAIPPDTVAFIKEQEGFRPTPYWDHQQWTVGYGTEAKDPGETVSEEEAEQRLKAYLAADCLPTVEAIPRLTAGQKTALLSFCYNVGITQFKGSTPYQSAKIGDHARASDGLLEWTKASGKENQGLVTRRSREKMIYDHE